VRFDAQAWQAMARIYAREAALQIASEGLAMVIGSVDNPGDLSAAVNMDAIQSVQKGLTADMDLVAVKLKQTFKAK